MTMRWIAAIAVLLFAACAPVQEEPLQPPPPPATVEKPAVPATEEMCKAQAGQWAPICRLQQPQCVLTFSDAGTLCTDSDQCQGSCYADTANGPLQPGVKAVGRCSLNSNPCGCNQRVEDGMPTPTLCVD